MFQSLERSLLGVKLNVVVQADIKITACHRLHPATNRTVCTISVVHSQIKDPERVIEVLCEELELPEETVRKRVLHFGYIKRPHNGFVLTYYEIFIIMLAGPVLLLREVLCEELELPEETVRKRVEKYSAIERIKTNVEKEIGDRIRAYQLEGVKIDRLM